MRQIERPSGILLEAEVKRLDAGRGGIGAIITRREQFGPPEARLAVEDRLVADGDLGRNSVYIELEGQSMPAEASWGQLTREAPAAPPGSWMSWLKAKSVTSQRDPDSETRQGTSLAPKTFVGLKTLLFWSNVFALKVPGTRPSNCNLHFWAVASADRQSRRSDDEVMVKSHKKSKDRTSKQKQVKRSKDGPPGCGRGDRGLTEDKAGGHD